METVKGPKPSCDRKLLPLEYRLRMFIVKTLLLPPSLKCALGRWSKRCVENSWLTNPKKLRRSNVIAQSTMRGGLVYSVREKAICSFNIDFTCTHGGGNNCKRHVKSSRHKDYESFEEIPAVLFTVSGRKARWGPAGHHYSWSHDVQLVSSQDL